ncbi:MAG: hypothetical protein R2750_09535 [Bacteroidales bacterium]
MEYKGTLCLTGPPAIPPVSATSVVIYQGDVTFRKANIYFLDDTRLYNTNYGANTLSIEKNVSLFGTSGTSGLISYSDITFGQGVTFSGLNGERWGGLAVQNPDLYFDKVSFIDCLAILNSIPNLIIKDCDFLRAGLIGQYLYQNTEISEDTYFVNSWVDLYGYATGSLLIDDCHFTGPSFDNTTKGLDILRWRELVALRWRELVARAHKSHSRPRLQRGCFNFQHLQCPLHPNKSQLFHQNPINEQHLPSVALSKEANHLTTKGGLSPLLRSLKFYESD